MLADVLFALAFHRSAWTSSHWEPLPGRMNMKEAKVLRLFRNASAESKRERNANKMFY